MELAVVQQQQQQQPPSIITITQEINQKGVPKSKRKLQKHLRSAGLEYVSRTGKLIPAKKVSEELCQCPHKCDELVPMEARNQLFQHFYGLGEADSQNQFLRTNMDLRARLNIPESTGSGRPPRRITCKYLVPLLDEGRAVEVCQKAFVSAFVITTKRVRLQREKLIASLGLNSYRSHNRSKKDKDEKKLEANNNNNNNNDSLMLNNNTITLSSLKSKFNLPSNLSVILPSSATSSSSVNNNNEQKNQNQYFYENYIHYNNNNNNNNRNNKDIMNNSNSAKKLASILGKKSLEELKELNITLEQTLSSSNSDSTAEEPSEEEFSLLPKKRFKKHTNNNRKQGLLLDNPLLPMGLVIPDGVTIAPIMGPDHDRDIAIVNNFFHNQLWKPEYIGAYS